MEKEFRPADHSIILCMDFYAVIKRKTNTTPIQEKEKNKPMPDLTWTSAGHKPGFLSGSCILMRTCACVQSDLKTPTCPFNVHSNWMDLLFSPRPGCVSQWCKQHGEKETFSLFIIYTSDQSGLFIKKSSSRKIIIIIKTNSCRRLMQQEPWEWLVQ